MVVSDRMDKTIVVEIQRLLKHPVYNRIIRRRARFKAHDGKNEAHIGDRVKIAESRPLSRTKRWHLLQIIERAKEE